MTLMGCGDGAEQCQVLRQVDTNWSSIEHCQNMAQAEIEKVSSANFPVIVASCHPGSEWAVAEAATRVQPETALPPAKYRTVETSFTDYLPGYDAAGRMLGWARDKTVDMFDKTSGWIRKSADFNS